MVKLKHHEQTQAQNVKLKKVSKPFTDACFTCKKRRVQCDMTKPFCNTCKSKKNLVCEGFDVKLRWSDPIEFDVFGDISANPKNSKILDSDNKDPQYQRRKIKYLHYKEEYEYYDEMDDELTALNKVLSQHKVKIMDGETWIIKKFGVFEGISYAKIQYQKRMKKQKLRMLKKELLILEKEEKNKANGKRNLTKTSRNKRKADEKILSTLIKDPITGKFESEMFVYDDNINKLPRNLRQKQNTNPAADPMSTENESKFFTDFFDNLHSPFNAHNSGVVKKGFIPVTPSTLTSLAHPLANIHKPATKHSVKPDNNTEWGILPSYLEDIFKNHHDSFDMDSGAGNSNVMNQELLTSKEPLVNNTALSLMSNNNAKPVSNDAESQHISAYYKESEENIESLSAANIQGKHNLPNHGSGAHRGSNSISTDNGQAVAYNFLNDHLSQEGNNQISHHPQDGSLSLSPNENKLVFDIKELEKKKHVLRQEVDNLLNMKQQLLKDLKDMRT